MLGRGWSAGAASTNRRLVCWAGKTFEGNLGSQQFKSGAAGGRSPMWRRGAADTARDVLEPGNRTRGTRGRGEEEPEAQPSSVFRGISSAFTNPPGSPRPLLAWVDTGSIWSQAVPSPDLLGTGQFPAWVGQTPSAEKGIVGKAQSCLCTSRPRWAPTVRTSGFLSPVAPADLACWLLRTHLTGRLASPPLLHADLPLGALRTSAQSSSEHTHP